MKPFNYKTVLFEFKTKCLARLFFMCVICSLFSSCIYSQQYSKEWPQISTVKGNKCPNISGTYKNKAIVKKSILGNDAPFLLGNVLIEQSNFTESAIVKIFQTDTSIEVSVHRTDEVISIYPTDNLIGEQELIFNKDIFCEENQITISESGCVADILLGCGSTKYTFQMAEDGSLILHAKTSVAGVAAVVIPIVASESQYYLFEKHKPGKP